VRDEHLWPALDSDADAEPEPGVHAAERTDEIPAVGPTRASADAPTSHSAGNPTAGNPGAGSHRAGGAAEAEAEQTQQIAAVGPTRPIAGPIAGGTGPERTQFYAPGAAETTAVGSGADAATSIYRSVGEPGEPAEPAEPEERRRWRTPLLIGAAVFGLLVLLYGGDLLISSGKVPRGVAVAGVQIGGLSQDAAEGKLRAALEPRLTQPVKIKAGAVETQLEPESSGLDMDWAGTLEQAGDQPLNPITRITSFFTERQVSVVSKVNRAALTTALNDRREELGTEPREGTITFTPAPGGKVAATPVDPKQGQQADVAGAVTAIADNWLETSPVPVPVETRQVKTTPEGVRRTLEQVARPAVAEPLVLRGNGANATLQPTDIARSLKFVPGDGGALKLTVDPGKVKGAAQRQLAPSEQEGRNATVAFTGGAPTVKGGTEGRAVAWRETAESMPKVLALTGNKRQLKAQYHKKPPDVTTGDVDRLGIREVIGEFTTSDFKTDSGENIRRVAEQVNGAIIKPGQTFSLNEYTGPRTAAQCYVDAGIIEDGVPSRAVGGGISQFATTLYNATYFAGLKDAGHQEHSYYISRYPQAREATVYQGADGEIDLAFTNDAPTGVAIQTIWTPDDITVKIWGTKRYRVESITGPRKNPVKPATERGKPGVCEATDGVPGFTSSDTRVLYDINSGAEVSRHTRNVSYNAEPKIICP
jgi:vancomycin resistance protein YoaR